jgi:plastocyanin
MCHRHLIAALYCVIRQTSLGVSMIIISTRVVIALTLSCVLLSTSAAIAAPQSIAVLNAQGQPAQNMVVYLLPSDPANIVTTVAPPKAEVHQKDKQFSPYITVVQKGNDVAFVNEDDITHHIFSALGPKRFSFKLRHQQQQQILRFEQTGHVSMGCNVHDWMSGHLLVVDTPYYAVTNLEGIVAFADLPADDFKLVVWHPQLKMPDNQQVKTVHFPSDNAMTITLQAEFDNIPSQQSLDEFEFLEGY